VIFYEIKDTPIKGGSTADMFTGRFPIAGDAETGFKMPTSFTDRRAAFQIWASDAKASIMLAEDLLGTMQGTATPGVKTVGQVKNLAKWLLWFKHGDDDKALQRELNKLREKIGK